MATETFTRLVDDIDGSKAERTVVFSWDGKGYAIDLSKKNIAALEKALKPYVAAARRRQHLVPQRVVVVDRRGVPIAVGRAACGRFVNGPEPTVIRSAIGAALVGRSWRRTKPPSSQVAPQDC